MGITFTVYSDGENIDRAWPFDVVPRIIPGDEWSQVERGLAQRLRAVNMFIDDLYNEQRIITAGVFPAELLEDSVNFRPECVGAHPKFGVWAHISGSDLVRDDDGTFYVLEDNLRVPSGVSYVLENRGVTKRAFPELFGHNRIRPVDTYTDALNKLLSSLAPDGVDNPTLVVLTPGVFNSAYFEHSFLAQRMGAELVEGGDLVVGDDDCVYMHTTEGRRARPRDLPAHRRPVPRPRSLPTRLDARRRRADACVEGGQRRHRERTGRRRRRRQVCVRLDARHHPLLPRRGAADRQRADLSLHVRRRARLRPRPPGGTRHEAGERERRVRHHDREPCERGTSSRRAPRRSSTTRGTGWHSRSSTCRRCPR